MTLEPPQPPTAPAPAVRPTPPTPPRIDMTPFKKNSAEEVNDDSPEAQAREAVANGSGALTKRTVERPEEKTEPANQTVTVIPPDAPLISDTQSDYDKGKDVLREFKEMDAREAQSTQNPPASTSTEQRQTVTPKINYHEGHGGFFWIFTIIFVAVAAAVVVKKFLFTGKSSMTKTKLFEDTTSRLKAVEEKVKPSTPPPKPKPAKLPPKKDDDKGKHFEVRV